MKIVIFGLTITSAWGNGHATTYRSLTKALARRGHRIIFVEKNVYWYRDNRDLADPVFCSVKLYEEWRSSERILVDLCCDADAIVIGSYFPDAIAATETLLAADLGPILFYDIDTPITVATLLSTGRIEYLDSAHVPFYDAYLSFTGGPVLDELCNRFGAKRALPFYCSVDPDMYKPSPMREEYRCCLSYLGTHAADRQLKLMSLLNEPAKLLANDRFIVAGAMYPHDTAWNVNVKTMNHIAPSDHAVFYSSSRFTLNLTRSDMVASGYSPSVRLFEASACQATILSDSWKGMDDFLTPGEEVILPRDANDVADILCNLSDAERTRIGRRARERVLEHHTSMHRALQFEDIVSSIGSTPKNLKRLPQTIVGIEQDRAL